MIAVQDLSFTYPGAERPTLHGLTFSIRQGEVYGLLGPSGAGKSTTQRILMGLQRGFSGRVEVFGQPIAGFGRRLYERIGVSFELPAVYLRLSAVENLKLFAALYDKPCRPAREVLALVDLADAADQRVETFSKGMKMRLNLARALLHEPELLFLDEPTTGQDPGRARSTRQLIKRLRAEGRTIFLTTHNMAEAEEVCDQVGFLVGGCIPVSGAPPELKRAYGQRLLEVTVQTADGLDKHLFALDGIGRHPVFLSLLARDEIVAMHTQEASLDEVFVRATGGAGGPPAA